MFKHCCKTFVGSTMLERVTKCLCKLQTPGKTCERHISQGNWTFLITDKWLSSLNFKVSCYFPLLVVDWFHFEFPYVAWHDLSCFLGETISNTFDLPMIIKHFSWSSVCCLLSKWISSIGLFIVSKMKENPMVKYVLCDPVDVNSGHACRS